MLPLGQESELRATRAALAKAEAALAKARRHYRAMDAALLKSVRDRQDDDAKVPPSPPAQCRSLRAQAAACRSHYLMCTKLTRM